MPPAKSKRRESRTKWIIAPENNMNKAIFCSLNRNDIMDATSNVPMGMCMGSKNGVAEIPKYCRGIDNFTRSGISVPIINIAELAGLNSLNLNPNMVQIVQATKIWVIQSGNIISSGN